MEEGTLQYVPVCSVALVVEQSNHQEHAHPRQLYVFFEGPDGQFKDISQLVTANRFWTQLQSVAVVLVL